MGNLHANKVQFDFNIFQSISVPDGSDEFQTTSNPPHGHCSGADVFPSQPGTFHPAEERDDLLFDFEHLAAVLLSKQISQALKQSECPLPEIRLT